MRRFESNQSRKKSAADFSCRLETSRQLSEAGRPSPTGSEIGLTVFGRTVF
jgi:hypothetical protein